ncbi:MAG: heavy metal sensor histidine kinase [Pseudomonadota bacterium]
MRRPRSITRRLTLFFATASTLVLLAVGHLTHVLLESHFEEEDFAEVSGKLELVRHALAKITSEAGLETVGQPLTDALVGHHDLVVAVIGPDQRGLFVSPGASFPPALWVDFSPDPPVRATTLRYWEQNGRNFRGLVASAATGIAGQPSVTVAIAVDIKHHRVFMAALGKSLWGAIALGIGLTAVLGWIAARRGLEPVHQVAKVARGISASRLDDRLPVDTIPVELREMALAFNDMLSRLEGSFRRLVEFSSDLAHELRTPINNLMTQTQVVLSRPRSADNYRETLYSNLEEYERLARTISDMLFLAKADYGLLVPRWESVDLAVQVRQLFEFYEALADSQGIGLRLSGEGLAPGDPLMLRRALGNLLSNAIRHTPRGGTIEMRIDRPGTAPLTRLVIENPGADIPPEHLPRLFDRFYRADPSRRQSSEGAGLGLAIVKSIVEAHGGSIQVSSSHEHTQFEITLPAMLHGSLFPKPHTAPDPADVVPHGVRNWPDS